MSAIDRATHKPVLNVNSWLQNTEFNSFHLIIFILCLLIITIDGYDLFVMGAVIPYLMRDFHLSPAAAGALGGYASFGGVFGAILIGFFADRLGRKRALLIVVAIFSILMGLSSLTYSIALFAIYRFFTGMTVGGCHPAVAALASEYAPVRRRALMIAGIFSGMPFGGVWAALLGMWFISRYGWRSVLLIGAAPLLLIPVLMRWLPESPGHLIKRNLLDELRRYLAKARPNEGVPTNVIYEADVVRKVPIGNMFQEHRGFSTIVFWIMYPVNFYINYGFTIWLPKLVMNRGFSLNSGLLSLLAMGSASILGSFLFGHIADRVGQRPVIVVAYILTGVFIGLVGVTHSFAYLMIFAALAGLGLNGAQNNFIGYIALYYPPKMRATAVGSCQFWGRIGAFGGPALIGVLMSLHFSYTATVFALALPNIISVIGIIIVRHKYSFTYIRDQEVKLAAVPAAAAAEAGS